MKIGHSRRCLSPEGEFYLIGYRHPDRYKPALGIHDDIYCNALLFEQDGKQVFLFSADFLEFEEEMAEDVKTLLNKKYNISRDAVLLAATHDHSSVVGYHKSWYTQKFDPKYYEFLLNTIQECFEECRDNAKEASARMGSEVILGYFGNRNHPGKPADNEVIVIKFYDQDNKPFAGLVNWAVHSTVIPGSNRYLSADLAGNVSVKLKDAFGFYPAMVVGCAGDCSNRNERQGNDFAELERVSTALAEIIAKIPCDMELNLDQISVQTLFHTIHHDMEEVKKEARKEIEKIDEQLLNNPPDAGFLKSRRGALVKELEETGFHLDAKGSVIRLGDLSLFVFPGELGSGFAPALKDSANHKAVVAGYTNGYYEYFMPEKEYGLSFETAGCRIPAGEPEKLIEKYTQAARNLLK